MSRATVVLLLLVVTLFYALATGATLYYKILYVLSLAFGVSYLWSYLNLRGVHANVRRGASRVQAGDAIDGSIMVRNSSMLPKAWLEVQELTTMPGPGAGRVINLGGYGTRSWRSQLLARQRGVFTLGPVQVSSSDPFGLFRRTQVFPGVHEVVVYPATLELPYLSLPGSLFPEEGPRRKPSQEPTPYASSVREYLPSDTFSRIHWPSTVRKRRLMVKQFDRVLGTDLWILVDLHQGVQAGSGYETTDETAVTVAASVASKFLGLGVPVGLVAYGQEPVRLAADQGVGQLGRMMELLARAKAEGQMPMEDLLLSGRRLFEPSSTILVVTPSAGPAWPAALAPLRQRGARAMAVLVDPASFGGAVSVEEMRDSLAIQHIPTYVVRRGEPLATALSTPWEVTASTEAGPVAGEAVYEPVG